MNMLNHPVPHHAWPLMPRPQGACYDLSIRVSIEDGGLLWRSAAAYLFSFYALDEVELEEMIGPREAPCIAGCIVVLLGPSRQTGLHYEDFAISPAEPDNDPPHHLCGG